MSKVGLLVLAAQFSPRFILTRPGTWLAVAVGLVGLLVMLISAAYAVFSWVWGQG